MLLQASKVVSMEEIANTKLGHGTAETIARHVPLLNRSG